MARLKVKIGELTKPISTASVTQGTTLEGFLTNRKIEYSASVRVNALVKPKGYVLRAGDIITLIEPVDGGC